jgi:penicillin amidase
LLQRAIRYINITVGVLLLAALALTYWYGWRPLAQTSGTVRAGVAQKVTVARDELGTPHIRAHSQRDALFAQGYATAQDRLWQMDGLRRLAAGELAEIIGPAGLESDHESRRLRLRRLAERAYISLPAGDRADLAAYASGVNAFIDSHMGRLPLEFTLLDYHPRPWSAVDSLLIGLHMFRSLTASWRDELAKSNMLAQGNPAKVNLLFPARSGREAQPGSNAWVLAGSRTATGKPLLANDMHLEFSLPCIWYMVHLEAPGLNVAGVALPGVPGVVVGHNQRIAWGVTNLQFDVQDLYLLKFDDRTGRYLYRGKVEQARAERETIRVKGRAPVELLVWVTRHGPLWISDGNTRAALRWAAAEVEPFQFPFLELNRAQNWQQFTAALARYPGPAQNFIYADVDGNIGYHAAGKLPLRKGFSGELPVDGSSGESEWAGFIPFNDLPAAFNPPSGLIVTANQNPFPAGYPHVVSGNFAPHYRSSQIRALLSARGKWRAEEMLGVQTDVYSPFSHYLARALVTAYERRKASNPALADALDLLRSWNGQMDRAQSAPLVVTLAYQHLRRAAAENAAPGKGAAYDYQMAPAALENLLRTRPAGWFRDYDEQLLIALVDGVEEGRRMQGRDVKGWRYGDYLRLRLDHPVLQRIPLVGRYSGIGPAPLSGASTTVKQTTHRLGPSMRMSADLASWDRSLLNVSIGQSGQFLSPHYRDQWDRYYTGRSFPMRFQQVPSDEILELVPEGNP